LPSLKAEQKANLQRLAMLSDDDLNLSNTVEVVEVIGLFKLES
jgi:hypothetical protein